MIKFKVIGKKVVDDWNSNVDKGHIFQTSGWCEVKSDWRPVYIGGYDGDNLVFTCSILLRKLPYINKYIGYSNRGFVCDFSDKVLIKSFVEYLRKFCKEENVAFVTFDPDIHLKENECPLESASLIIDNLKGAGLKHLDSGSKNFEGFQPKFVFRLDISPLDGESAADTKKRIYNSYHKKWKYNMKLGKERFLEVDYYDKSNITDEVLDAFQELMNDTGKRDNFLVRNKNYFARVIESVDKYSRIYLVKYNVAKDKKEIDSKILDLTQKNINLNAKIKEFEDLFNGSEETASVSQSKKYRTNKNVFASNEERLEKLNIRKLSLEEISSEYVYLSGALYLYYGDKAWYLYGASSSRFRDVMPSFSMQEKMINDSIDLGMDTYDFRGVSGDITPENPLYGLYKFKKGFGGDFVEFIGEFDLVIDNFIYKAFREIFPRFKKIRAMIKNKK